MGSFDGFERGDGQPLGTADSGETWTELEGTWQVYEVGAEGLAGAATLDTTDTMHGMAVIDAATDVQNVRALVPRPGNSGQWFGVLARVVDSDNCWYAFVYRSLFGTPWYFYAGKLVAGARNDVIAFEHNLGVLADDDYEIRLDVNAADEVAVYFDGVQIGTTLTDSAHAGATGAGITQFGSDGPGFHWFQINEWTPAIVGPFSLGWLPTSLWCDEFDRADSATVGADWDEAQIEAEADATILAGALRIQSVTGFFDTMRNLAQALPAAFSYVEADVWVPAGTGRGIIYLRSAAADQSLLDFWASGAVRLVAASGVRASTTVSPAPTSKANAVRVGVSVSKVAGSADLRLYVNRVPVGAAFNTGTGGGSAEWGVGVHVAGTDVRFERICVYDHVPDP